MRWIRGKSSSPRYRFPFFANSCFVHSRRGWGIEKDITEENKIIPVIVFSIPVIVFPAPVAAVGGIFPVSPLPVFGSDFPAPGMFFCPLLYI